MKILNKLKNDDGFTLLEVVISIAVLSIISGFILQMFIVSANANNTAKDMDLARELSKAIIENVKASDSYDEAMELYNLKDGGSYILFNSMWEEVYSISIAEYELGEAMEADILANDISFILIVKGESSSETATENTKTGDLVEITTSIYKRNTDGVFVFEKTLMDLKTNKYFPKGE